MNSQPAGAQYQIGPFNGKTPDSIAIPKKSIPDFATFELAGYEKKTVPIESGITGVFWVNILFWPGMIVDIVTGDYKTLDVNEITASLSPVPGSAQQTAPAASTTAATATAAAAPAAAAPPAATATPSSWGASSAPAPAAQ